MSTMFDDFDEDKRRRLVRRGWTYAGKLLSGKPCWRDPGTQAVYEESEAFAWLARTEADELKKMRESLAVSECESEE